MISTIPKISDIAKLGCNFLKSDHESRMRLYILVYYISTTNDQTRHISKKQTTTYVSPVPVAVRRKTLEALDEQHARIADLSLTRSLQLEAIDEVEFVLFRVGKTRAIRMV